MTRPIIGHIKHNSFRIKLPSVAFSLKSALQFGQLCESEGITAPQYSHFFKSVLIGHQRNLFRHQYQHSYVAVYMLEVNIEF